MGTSRERGLQQKEGSWPLVPFQARLHRLQNDIWQRVTNAPSSGLHICFRWVTASTIFLASSELSLQTFPEIL